MSMEYFLVDWWIAIYTLWVECSCLSSPYSLGQEVKKFSSLRFTLVNSIMGHLINAKWRSWWQLCSFSMLRNWLSANSEGGIPPMNLCHGWVKSLGISSFGWKTSIFWHSPPKKAKEFHDFFSFFLFSLFGLALAASNLRDELTLFVCVSEHYLQTSFGFYKSMHWL